ncbi:MAG: CvpA family protein [Chloroflexota bacterium]
MNAVDISILVVSLISAVSGLRRGLVKSVLTVAGLVVGVILAGRYYDRLAELISPSGADWVKILAYCIIVGAVSVAGSIAGAVVSRIVGAFLLGWLDKLLGALVGLVLGGLFSAAILIVISMYIPGAREAVSQSKLAPIVMEKIPLLLVLLPGQFDFIRDFFRSPPGGL